MQLSLPIIDRITAIADECSVGIKITGAGCGGCLLAVYSESSDIKAFYAKIESLKDEGVYLIRADKSSAGFTVDNWQTSF